MPAVAEMPVASFSSAAPAPAWGGRLATMDRRKRLRLALMEERSVTQAVMEDKFTEENHFNFCEH